MELIYYVDTHDRPTGETEEKYAAHHANTKLHAAFSCYIFNVHGELLVARRADSKKVWPGVWTNSFCGHPMPSETREGAIARRGLYELGIHVRNIVKIVPDYIYTTPPFKGIIEHEYCPIYFAITDDIPTPNPDEVSNIEWHKISSMSDIQTLLHDAREWSWWFNDQVATITKNKVLCDAADAFISSCAQEDTQPNQSKN